MNTNQNIQHEQVVAEMDMNIILTFDFEDGADDHQDIFDHIAFIMPSDTVFTLLNRELFSELRICCEAFNRNIANITMISTCSNWEVFTQATGNPLLRDCGYTGKWWFNPTYRDVNPWEDFLMRRYGIGAKYI